MGKVIHTFTNFNTGKRINSSEFQNGNYCLKMNAACLLSGGKPTGRKKIQTEKILIKKPK
jgi:hypothetical protein